jgi:hypothetical protein
MEFRVIEVSSCLAGNNGLIEIELSFSGTHKVIEVFSVSGG